MQPFAIAPSILSANFARQRGSDNVPAAGPIVHFDVMDNHHVFNLTIGPMVRPGAQELASPRPSTCT